MKITTPPNRNFSLPRSYRVLDVGGGHYPHPRADIVVEKYLDDNTHRSGNVMKVAHQEVIHADGENLPFGDKEFDFVFCNHVLEHVEDPEKFVREIVRVGKSGYIETPSLPGEYIAPKKSHKWVALCIDHKIVMFDKEVINLNPSHDFGDIFLRYLPKYYLAYRVLRFTDPNIMTMRVRWEDSIEVVVNPLDNPRYVDIFTQPWKEDNYSIFFPKKSAGKILGEFVFGTVHTALSVMNTKFLNRKRYRPL